MNNNDYPSNSHRSKDPDKAKEIKKNIQPVISNPAKTKKKNGWDKVKDSLVTSDGTSILTYLAQDVLIPAAKKMFVQAVKNGIDMLVYGELTSNETKNGKVQYRNRYEEVNRRESRGYRNPRRSVLDYENVVFDTKQDAQEVFDGMDDIIDRYGFVSVSDMYDLSGVPNDNYTLQKYGWQSIRTARIIQVRDGFVLDMPKAMPID